jgi:hypothetical protein
MALQETDLFIVQRNAQSYKMAASEIEALIGGGVQPGPDEPTDKQPGDLWYDTDTNVLYYWNGSVWVPITPETPDGSQPSDPVPGQLWYDTSVQALKCYVGGDWVFSIKGAEAGSTDPATGSELEGQLFYNTTQDTLKVYSDGAWTETGGGASVDVGTSAPANPTEGNLWWNSEEGILYIYYGPDADGTEQWVQAAGSAGGGGSNVSISPTKPDSAVEGDLWFNSDNGRLFIYYTGDVWVDASPAGQFNGGVVENSVTSPERQITAGSFDISTGCFWTADSIDIPNPTNCVAGMTGTIRFTGTPTSWGSYFKFSDGVAPSPVPPAIIAFYVQDASTILLGGVLNNYA